MLQQGALRFVLLATVLILARPGWSRAPGEAAPVRVASVMQVTAPKTITVVGDVEPRRRSIVSAKESSAVVEFPHQVGDFVKEGDLLAQLEIDILELDLEEAKALLEVRRAMLAELENGTRPEVIEAQRAKYQGAVARRELTQLQRERAERLSRERAASEEEMDQALAASETAKYEVEQFKAELTEVENGPRKESIDQARASVQSQQSVVERLQRRIQRHQVTAPFDGYIAVESTEIGEWVDAGDPVVEVLDLEEVDVNLPVPSRYVNRISVGMDVRIDIDSAHDQLLVGKVIAIVPEADRQSRLVPVKVRVINRKIEGQPALKSGMLGRAQIAVGDSEATLQVPKDAIVLGIGQPFVFRVVSSEMSGVQTVEPVEVILGSARGEFVEVRGALRDGDQVVTQGNERLRPGQTVAVLNEANKS